MRRSLFCCVALLACFSAAAGDVIICGSGGDPEYVKSFADWGHRLAATLVSQMDRPKSGIRLMLETAADDVQASTLQQIRDTFSALAKSHDKKSDLYVYLIGHGSHLVDGPKFQIPGPDLTAAELKELISAVPARRVIVVVAISSGAGFLNALSAPNRIICSATKSSREVNATEFMSSFIESLESGGADRNRDERISVAEVCRQAAALTESWYLANGMIATEHAILDDNGDGLGTRLYSDPNKPEKLDAKVESRLDGDLAEHTFLKDLRFPASVPQSLVDAYLAAIGDVEKLTVRKAEMSQDDYYRRLERELLKAARLHREIRRLAGK